MSSRGEKRYRILFILLLSTLVIFTITGILASKVTARDVPIDTPAIEPAVVETPFIEVINPYFSIKHMTLSDGTQISGYLINGPPSPPVGYEAERVASSQPIINAVILPDFPSFSWVFGCSSVSGAMIAGYYDRGSYPNMYTGPTNSGVMPLSDTSWPTWTDGSDTYPNNPLIASHDGVDGRSVRGSIDDYWVSYLSEADDPYVTNGWPQHTWGTAIGDYMKTSQSEYGNVDGSTAFYYYPHSNNKLTCIAMEGGGVSGLDGTYGRKRFYEDRGYTVSDCYNQSTDNTVHGGFSLANFQAEIDAGYPVLLNLAGHSIVGYGYDGSTIYIRNTWDSNPGNTFTMTWGGSYAGMELLSVSVVHLIPGNAPGAFNKSSPPNGDIDVPISPTLSWDSSSDAASYEYCYDTTSENDCTEWTSNGIDTSIELPELNPDTTYYWQVRAVNIFGTTYADGSATAFWSFTTETPTAINLFDFIASSALRAVRLKWRTAQEIDLVGFNLMRAEAMDGPRVKINPKLITGINPGQLQGNAYQYLDTTAKSGEAYYYWIEYVGTGSSEFYGPVTARTTTYTVWLPLGMR